MCVHVCVGGACVRASVYMCMCVYMCVFVHVRVFVHGHVRVCVCMYIKFYVFLFTCIRLSMYVTACVSMCLLYLCVCACV